MAFDPDCLVERLNELANNAQEPSYTMTRTNPVGTPLSYTEFNTLSSKVSWLSQNRYVGDYDDPDSFVNYDAVVLTADSQVTTLRLREVFRAMTVMQYVRRDISWTGATITQVVVTHASPTENNYIRALA